MLYPLTIWTIGILLLLCETSFSDDYRPYNDNLMAQICVERSNNKISNKYDFSEYSVSFMLSNRQGVSLYGNGAACMYVEPSVYNFTISAPGSEYTTKYYVELSGFEITATPGSIHVIDVFPISVNDIINWKVVLRESNNNKAFVPITKFYNSSMCFERILARDINDVSYDNTLNGLVSSVLIYRESTEYSRKRGTRYNLGGASLKGGQAECIYLPPGLYINSIWAPFEYAERDPEGSQRNIIEVLERVKPGERHTLNIIPQYVDRYRLLWLTEFIRN